MASSYPHWLTVERGGGQGQGTQDPGTGIFTPATATPTTTYSDFADVQRRRVVLQRDVDGTPLKTADAIAFLADESLVGEIHEDDVAVVTWEDGSKDDCVVAEVDRLSGTVLLTGL